MHECSSFKTNTLDGTLTNIYVWEVFVVLLVSVTRIKLICGKVIAELERH